MEPTPLVSIVVVADGPWEETLRCLTALARATAGLAHEVIVVDDGTADETAVALPRLPGVVSIRGDTPQGFALAANAGASVARAPLIAFLHGDAAPHPSWLGPLLEAAADPSAVLIGSRLVDPQGDLEGTSEPAVPRPGVSSEEPCSAAAMLVRREAFLAVEGFRGGGSGWALAEELAARLGLPGGRGVVARASSVRHQGRCGSAEAPPGRRAAPAPPPSPAGLVASAGPSGEPRPPPSPTLPLLSWALDALVAAGPRSVLEVGVREGGLGLLIREALQAERPGTGGVRIEGTFERAVPPGAPAAAIYDRLHRSPPGALPPGLGPFDLVCALDALWGLDVEAGKRRLGELLRATGRHLLVALPWSPVPAPPGTPRRSWTPADLGSQPARLRFLRTPEGGGLFACVLAPEGKAAAPIPPGLSAALDRADQVWAGPAPARRPLRITYLVPHHNLTGGLKVLLEQIRWLGARGHRVRAVFRGRASRALPPWSDVAAAEERILPEGASLAEAFEGSDVVVCGVFPTVPECAAAGRPTLYLEQGHEFLFELPQGQGDHLDQVFRQFDRALTTPTPVATISPFVSELLARSFGRRTMVIPNGIDPARFHPAPVGTGARVLLVGNPTLAFKGFDAALAALRRAHRQVPGLSVTWVSQVPVPATDLPFPVENVVNPPQERLPGIFRGHDVHLFTSRYEAFALPPLEAMASGVPVVSTDCGGIRAFAVHGDNCLLASPGDDAALGEAVARVLLEPALKARLAQRGRETAEAFSMERSIDALEEALARVAARAPLA